MKNLLIILCALLFACGKPPITQTPPPTSQEPPATGHQPSTIRAMALPQNNASIIGSTRWESLYNYISNAPWSVAHRPPKLINQPNPSNIKINIAGFTNNRPFLAQLQADSTLQLSVTLNKGKYNWALYFCQYFDYEFRKADSTQIDLLFYQKINGRYKQFGQSGTIKFKQKDILRPFWWSGSGLSIFEDGTELTIIIKVDERMAYQKAHLCALEILPETQEFFYFRHTKIQYDKDGNVLGLAIEEHK